MIADVDGTLVKHDKVLTPREGEDAFIIQYHLNVPALHLRTIKYECLDVLFVT